MLKQLKFGLYLTNRVILWFAGTFAILGLLWRSSGELTPLSGVLLTLALAVSVECLISLSAFFSETPYQKTPYLIGHYELLIPALLFGFLLPLPLPILYIALLGTAELARWFWTKPATRKQIAFAIPAARMDQEEESYDAENNDSVTQQMVRSRSEEGADRLEGNFLVEFRDDQLTATIHVPFCPAFDSVPKIEVYCLDDVNVKWNIFEPRNFGVRIDVKRFSRETPQVRMMIAAEVTSSDEQWGVGSGEKRK